MGAAYFYHLTRNPLEIVLPMLLGKAREAGWQVLVRGANPRRLEQLDEALWTFRDDAFLPHGLAGGPHDADQPILLTSDAGVPLDRACLMCIEGADVTPDEIAWSQRTCILFDGADPAALEKARAQWRSLTAAQTQAQYWSEETGKWTKKAESG